MCQALSTTTNRPCGSLWLLDRLSQSVLLKCLIQSALRSMEVLPLASVGLGADSKSWPVVEGIVGLFSVSTSHRLGSVARVGCQLRASIAIVVRWEHWNWGEVTISLSPVAARVDCIFFTPVVNGSTNFHKCHQVKYPHSCTKPFGFSP